MLTSRTETPLEQSAQNDTILNSFVSGTRWMLVLSALALPLSYLNNLLLGRISPKALGLYGLLLVSSSIVMLLMFGGGQTLVRFLPSIAPTRRIPFVLTYVLLVCGVAVVFLAVVLIKPALVSVLVRRPLDPETIRYLLPFIPLVLLTSIMRAILQARMEIKWMTIASKVVPAISLVGFLTLYILRRHVSDSELGEAILIVFCAAQLVSLGLATYHVYFRFVKVEPRHITLFLPAGFWSFGLMVSLSMIVILVLDNFDQALIFSQFEIAELGIYRASLTTAEFVRWLPVLLIQATLPLFSHLLADEQRMYVKLMYRRIVRYGTLATCVIALVIILFAREILSLFGPEYVGAEMILVLLASTFVFSGISTANSSLIVASGRVELGLISGVIGSLLQIASSLILVKYLGVEGAAIGKAVNFGCILVLNAWFVSHLADLRPDQRTIRLLAVFFMAVLASRVVRPDTIMLSFARNTILLAAFASLALYWFDNRDYRHLRVLIRGAFEA